MTRNDRMQLIKSIEEYTNSKLLVYITSDRRGLETRISSEVLPFIFKHVSKFKNTKKISLFLYTTGGITTSGFGIINMIREFCEKLDILVPYKALSTGTLMALGADNIIMLKMGQFSPIDPSINHPLAPNVQNKKDPKIKAAIPVNVEDVIGYFDLARTEANITSESGFIEVFKILCNGIHPIALGAINRAKNQTKYLAKTMLRYHINDEEKVERIVKLLVEERFSHHYIIGRREAKNVIGLNVVDSFKELDNIILKLYEEYVEVLQLNSIYSPELELASRSEATLSFHRGIVESMDLTHIYITEKNIKKIRDEQSGIKTLHSRFLENTLREGWLEKDAI